MSDNDGSGSPAVSYSTVDREYGPPSVGLAVCQANGRPAVALRLLRNRCWLAVGRGKRRPYSAGGRRPTIVC